MAIVEGSAYGVSNDLDVGAVDAIHVDPTLKLSDQSIQTFFYTAIRNHVDLAESADKKANTLMGVSVLLLSVLLLGVVQNWAQLTSGTTIAAIIVLVCSNVITILLSIFSTRPIMQKSPVKNEDLVGENVNLAFFQNFKHLEFEDFNWAVNNMKKDKMKVISVLTKDLYFLGKSINTKFNWVNRAYNVFLIGLALAFLFMVINMNWKP